MSKLYPIDDLTREEIQVLYNLFSIENKDKEHEKLTKKLSKILLPGNGLLQSGLSYSKFIEKIAIKNNIDLPKDASFYEKEKTLFVKLFAKSYNDMSDLEKEKLIKALSDNGLSKEQVASVTALATIGAAQLSGFGVYLLASSTVGTLSSVVGVTLPFAFYTGMSKVISIAIGPVGFLLAAYPIYKSYRGISSVDEFIDRSKDHYQNIAKGSSTFLKGNYELAETVFNYLAGLRIMKVKQIEDKILTLNNEVATTEKSKEALILEVRKLQKEVNRLNHEITNKRDFIKDNTSAVKILKNKLFSLKHPGVKKVDLDNMGSIPYRD
ncbi:hypothetical protein VBZ51_08335 [Maribacter sp. HS]|uniref:hypothetical protein n=1 Tax=Maribacter sp. HS TaxID=3110480 RepID=UPI003A8B117F